MIDDPTVVTLKVQAKTPQTGDVVTVTLVDPQGRRLPDWAPGSHIDLVLSNGLTRQYSLCGDRWDAYSYRIGVLREPAGRGGSAFVHQDLEPGHLVGVSAPRNNFPLVPSPRYRFVAGGIGITPILPMIHQADLVGADWQLLYGGRRRASMAFLDEVAGYGDRVRIHPQDELGLLPLAEYLGEPSDEVKIYCCGPGPLLNAIEAVCAHRPRHALRTERFVAADHGPAVHEGPFEVELARSGVTVTVAPQVSVLDAVHAAGIEVLASCRQGVCGTCETTVLAGLPDHRDSLLDDDDRVAADCMYPCVSRSCTATTDVPVGDQVVPDGKKILMFLGAANRDPRRWACAEHPDPDAFDLTRDPSGHVGFGMGIHQCIGQHVARLEAEAILTALSRRAARIELAGPVRRHHNNTLRAWDSLPVRLTVT